MADDEWQYGGEKQPQDDYPKRTTHTVLVQAN